jgi:acyl-CoA reductase-like NAD-dependent aldehyde dehydrogenase
LLIIASKSYRWNAPLILAFRGLAHILAAGCTVVLKASEVCPFTHQIMLECLAEAGLPAGAVNQVQCVRKDAGAVTEALIAHPAIRKVEFIGSAAVGRIIGSIAGKHLKPVLMELGDQSPAIVLEDADLKAAAAMIATGGESTSRQASSPQL